MMEKIETSMGDQNLMPSSKMQIGDGLHPCSVKTTQPNNNTQILKRANRTKHCYAQNFMQKI